VEKRFISGQQNAQPLAGHTISYHPYALEDALTGIAEAGFGGVELAAVPGWTEHVSFAVAPREVRRRVDAFGLAAVSISAHTDLMTRPGVDHTLAAIRWAADYGLPIVNGAIGGSWSDPEGEAVFLRHITELADAARAGEVVLALEIDGRMMGNGATTLPLIERIGRAEIRVNYDTANCEYETGVRAAEDLPSILSYVAHVHLKDTTGGIGQWDFPAVGEGSIDFEAVLGILRAHDYAGPLTVEIEFQGEPWPAREEVDRAMASSYRHLSSLALA
jgi:L-ribulose-5-phosphate 3-epimerase